MKSKYIIGPMYFKGDIPYPIFKFIACKVLEKKYKLKARKDKTLTLNHLGTGFMIKFYKEKVLYF